MTGPRSPAESGIKPGLSPDSWVSAPPVEPQCLSSQCICKNHFHNENHRLPVSLTSQVRLHRKQALVPNREPTALVGVCMCAHVSACTGADMHNQRKRSFRGNNLIRKVLWGFASKIRNTQRCSPQPLGAEQRPDFSPAWNG